MFYIMTSTYVSFNTKYIFRICKVNFWIERESTSGFVAFDIMPSLCVASGKTRLVQDNSTEFWMTKTFPIFFISNVANSLVKYVQGRRPSAVHTVRKHLRGRITWWTTSGSTRVSHRTSASIAPNPSRGRNIWPITCVNIQANRHTDATSAPSHLLVRSIWRIMCASTLANLHIGVSSARGRSLGKNI